MALSNGQSELDQINLRLTGLSPTYGAETQNINYFDRYTFNDNYTSNTTSWSFTVSYPIEQVDKIRELFIQGVKIEVVSNNNIQATGFIDKVDERSSRSGTEFVVSCKDILGPVVKATAGSQISITSNMSVLDFLGGLLSPYGIKKIYVSDEDNLNVITGFKGRNGGTVSQTTFSKVDDSFRKTADGKNELVIKKEPITQVITTDRKDLKQLKLDQRKAKFGDGIYQHADRILSRLGFKMRAAADGSGVIVDKPIFNGPINYKLSRKMKSPNSNNIIEGSKVSSTEEMPSMVIGLGFGGGGDTSKSSLVCIAINELVAVDTNGQNIKFVDTIIAQFPKAKVLPIRKQLVPKTERLSKFYLQKPLYIKDDDSRTIDQLSAYVRKQLSLKQKEFLTLEYTVAGHSQNGHPWAVNTLVDVDDDILGIHQPMWILEKVFNKARDGGTTTRMKLILPYTLELGAT